MIIEIRNLWKEYKIGQRERYLSLRDSMTQLFKPSKNLDSTFWALKDLNIDIQAGERVGIIGQNGAGKSTLLKILSKITPPTKGHIKLRGRIASLLEVGTGFHPELTGRENIYLNGAILGLRYSEIQAKFDEIVDFSGVERFLDTPLKRYSSGMQLRLAFAVAAHLEPEILVIDEVLAVGDAAFQKKCLGKMDEVAQSGRTILFVSHNMTAVKKLCNRSIWLHEGQMLLDGKTDEVVDDYLSKMGSFLETRGSISWSKEEAPQGKIMRFRHIRLLNKEGYEQATFTTNQTITVELAYELLFPVSGMRVLIRILSTNDVVLFTGDSFSSETLVKPAGLYTCRATIPSGIFNQGRFKVYIHSGCPGICVLVQGKPWIQFETELDTGGELQLEVGKGWFAPNIDWEILKE